mgnify:CR=1 FL=1|jgi:pyruvate/2-oxoglutarate dehydrogenase complex dihydrolipoamide dehydrogenase (E3) component
MIVIGGGCGGLTVAKSAVKMGAKVAVVEREFLGGQRLKSVVLPAFTKCANIAYAASKSTQYGVKIKDVKVNFAFIMNKCR